MRPIAAAVSCWLLLSVGPTTGAVSQSSSVAAPNVPLQAYLDLIEQYRRGEFSSAVVKLSEWTREDTTKSVVALMTRRTAFGDIPDVPVMFAAAMLHTDAAFDAAAKLAPSSGAFHLRAAADLLMWTVLHEPNDRRHLFARRDWRLMVTRVLNFYVAWSVEQSLVDPHPGPRRVDPVAMDPTEMSHARATEFIAPDADTELARGSLAEGFAYMSAREAKTNREKEPRALVVQCRQRAEDHFRLALSLRPDMMDARLRLGRVLLDVGRVSEADVELRAVVVAAADARTVHLASLFLGEASEQAGHFEAAVQHYARAVALRPESQTAHVALAQASERMGDMDRARSVIAWFLRRPDPRGSQNDDWTSYPWGQFQEGFEALGRLRASVVRK